MGFIRWMWTRSETYMKVMFCYVVIMLVSTTLTVTYESATLYRITQMLGASYFVWFFGYELFYKLLKEKYNTYKREQDELFDNIKNPK